MDENEDTQRRRMVERQLRDRGVTNARVLEAMAAVPRERFVPPEVRGHAYEDRALPLARGQTVSQPFMVAAMTEALEPGPGDRILEIGTGSGYQAAVLADLGAEVFSVERIAELADAARKRLDALGVEGVHIRVGDGTLGWEEEAPFDGIVVTAAAPRVPASLLGQLSEDGGRLVIPVGTRTLQELERWTRSGTEMRRESLFPCRFVPLVGEEGWSR